MAHTRNAALAARIAELGLTEKELSYLLNDAIEQTTGQRGKATNQYIRLLLNGTIQWPWPVNRRALEQVLGRSILELGFVPRGQSSVISPRCATAWTARVCPRARRRRRRRWSDARCWASPPEPR